MNRNPGETGSNGDDHKDLPHSPTTLDRLSGPVPNWAVALNSALGANRAENGRCLLWTGPVSGVGYPLINIGGRDFQLHRLMAALLYGLASIRGKHVHHLCEEKRCLGGAHLVPLTARQHRAMHAGRLRIAEPRKFDWKAWPEWRDVRVALLSRFPRRAA